MHLNMKNKGQAGVIIVVILIIIVGVFFLYKAGYLNFNQTTTTTTKNINPYIPISFNISTSTPLAHLYTGENINVISKIFNNGKNYINVVAFPYGCQSRIKAFQFLLILHPLFLGYSQAQVLQAVL